MTYLTPIITGLIIMLCLDAIWIYTIAHPAYVNTIGSLLRNQANLSQTIIIAIICIYALMISGLITFVLPKVHGLNTLPTLFYSGLYGLIIYGVFAMTNYAILQSWTIELMLLDTIWGFILFSTTTLTLKWLFPNL